MRRPVSLPLAALGLALCVWSGSALATPTDAVDSTPSAADPKAALRAVEEALEAWDIPKARAALKTLETLVPEDSEPALYYRGRIAFEDGRYAEAVKLLTAAGVEDKPESYVRLAKDSAEVTAKHERVESAHFIFYYPPGKDAVLAPYALETLESIRSALEKDLGFVPPEKVRVEVVNNARELSRVSTLTYPQIRTTGTIAICKFNKLMVTSPKAVLRGYDWMDTLAHEYVHLVLSMKSGNTVPIWLHEGMAKYLESRWRGAPGQAMTPSMLGLLGRRIKKNQLIPFAKMHPSIALLPTAEDAATAFAEVFFAIDLIYKQKGAEGLQAIIAELSNGKTDRQAVEKAMGMGFPAFESAWKAHPLKQNYPKGGDVPDADSERVVLQEDAPKKKKGKKDTTTPGFGDFAEVREPDVRRHAHLGELLRERRRMAAAAEEFGKAYARVGAKYESVANKYALSLMEGQRWAEAEKVLQAAVKSHPDAQTAWVSLGKTHLGRKAYGAAKEAYEKALATNPFDPEIHLGLLVAHSKLGQPKGVERAKSAASILTGRPKEQIERWAQSALADSASGVDGEDTDESSAGGSEE